MKATWIDCECIVNWLWIPRELDKTKVWWVISKYNDKIVYERFRMKTKWIKDKRCVKTLYERDKDFIKKDGKINK